MTRHAILAAALVAGLSTGGTLNAASETSLERWSSVEIREATEAVKARWEALLETGAIDTAPAADFAAARRAVSEALSGRRWDDDRERIYWIYQAQRAMDYAELTTTIVNLEEEIHRLTIRRSELDEVRIEREARRIAAEREADLRRREAEIARREAELALEREALASQQVAAEAPPPRIRTLPLIDDLGEQVPTLSFESTRRGPMLVLGDLLFEVDGKTPESRARSRLETLHAYLDANRDVTVSIEGHWDTNSPPRKANALSSGRANAVRDLLVELGLDASRVTARGFGGQQPIAVGSTATDHETNRRVELFLAAPQR